MKETFLTSVTSLEKTKFSTPVTPAKSSDVTATETDKVSLPSPPSMVSFLVRLAPNTKESLPRPPNSESLPVPAVSTSSPSPPSMELLPLPEFRASLPAPPAITSLPAPPKMVSAPAPPVALIETSTLVMPEASRLMVSSSAPMTAAVTVPASSDEALTLSVTALVVALAYAPVVIWISLPFRAAASVEESPPSTMVMVSRPVKFAKETGVPAWDAAFRFRVSTPVPPTIVEPATSASVPATVKATLAVLVTLSPVPILTVVALV